MGTPHSAGTFCGSGLFTICAVIGRIGARPALCGHSSTWPLMKASGPFETFVKCAALVRMGGELPFAALERKTRPEDKAFGFVSFAG